MLRVVFIFVDGCLTVHVSPPIYNSISFEWNDFYFFHLTFNFIVMQIIFERTKSSSLRVHRSAETKFLRRTIRNGPWIANLFELLYLIHCIFNLFWNRVQNPWLHRLNCLITILIRVSHYTFANFDWSIQTMQAMDFEPCFESVI